MQQGLRCVFGESVGNGSWLRRKNAKELNYKEIKCINLNKLLLKDICKYIYRRREFLC